VKAALIRLVLGAIQVFDRWRLQRLMRLHPGLSVHPEASSNFASARFELGHGARVRIEAGVHTERRRDGVRICVGDGGELVLGEASWLRSDVAPVHLAVFAGGRLHVGRDAFLNGCHLSSKKKVEIGVAVMVGSGSRVFDADQHPLDAARPERLEAVSIGDYVWIASDVTVLRGVTIGSHSVVGARSVVARSIEPHVVAAGSPAKPLGTVGDRGEPMEEWARQVRAGLGGLV